MTNNVSTKCQELKGFPWPEGTPDYVNVRVKQEYIQSYAEHFGVVPLIRFNTRVEKLEKVDNVWRVISTTLVKDEDGKTKTNERVEVIDLDFSYD